MLVAYWWGSAHLSSECGVGEGVSASSDLFHATERCSSVHVCVRTDVYITKKKSSISRSITMLNNGYSIVCAKIKTYHC